MAAGSAAGTRPKAPESIKAATTCSQFSTFSCARVVKSPRSKVVHFPVHFPEGFARVF